MTGPDGVPFARHRDRDFRQSPVRGVSPRRSYHPTNTLCPDTIVFDVCEPTKNGSPSKSVLK